MNLLIIFINTNKKNDSFNFYKYYYEILKKERFDYFLKYNTFIKEFKFSNFDKFYLQKEVSFFKKYIYLICFFIYKKCFKIFYLQENNFNQFY